MKERKKYKTKQKRAFQFSFCVIKTEYFSFNNQFGVKSSYNFFDRAIERERERERDREIETEKERDRERERQRKREREREREKEKQRLIHLCTHGGC